MSDIYHVKFKNGDDILCKIITHDNDGEIKIYDAFQIVSANIDTFYSKPWGNLSRDGQITIMRYDILSIEPASEYAVGLYLEIESEIERYKAEKLLNEYLKAEEDFVDSILTKTTIH